MNIAQIYLMYYDKLTQQERDICTTSSYAIGSEPTFETIDDFKSWSKDIIKSQEENQNDN